MTAPDTLRLIALITLITATVDAVSISHFACNDTWNPTVDCNSKMLVKKVCQLHLRLSDLVSDSANGSVTVPSSGKREHGLIQFIMTSGIERLKSTSLHGVDYWIVGSMDANYVKNDETNIDISDVTLTTPNICGQTWLICRLIVSSGDTVDLAIPLQLKCPENQVDLAIIGSVQEFFDMYNHRPVLHPTGQPLTLFMPDFKLYVRNVLNTTFSARTGPCAYTVSVYIKSQVRNMYDWSVGNNSHQTVLHVDKTQLEYQVGDAMVSEGNRLVPSDGGRRTLALPGGSQTELLMDNLTLTSKDVCGNGVMVVQLKVLCQPADSNSLNDFYILPVFVDCWGHNPVETIETCQVIPNYYDGGQTAWITYTVPGQTKVYEYKSDERSIRALNPDIDASAMQDIALMKLTTDIQSDRLKQLGQCVDTVAGSSDAFVTSVDVLATSLRKYWDEVEPKGPVQKAEHSKISLILSSFSEMLTLALQLKNPLNNWLHIPFQCYFNPLTPYESKEDSKHPADTNQISRHKRNIGGNSIDDDIDEFEAAAQQKSPSLSNSISSSSANGSSPLASSPSPASLLSTTLAGSLRSTTGFPLLSATMTTHTTSNVTKSGSGSMADSLSKGPLLSDGVSGQPTTSSTMRSAATSAAPSSTGAPRAATATTYAARGEHGSTVGVRSTAASSGGAGSSVSTGRAAATSSSGASARAGAAGPLTTPSYGASNAAQTNGGSTGTTARSAGATGTTARSAGATGTTARSAGSTGTTARSAGSTGTTARSAGSMGSTARSAESSRMTSHSPGSSGTAAYSARATAATFRGAGSSVGPTGSTSRGSAAVTSAPTARSTGPQFSGSGMTASTSRVTPTAASSRGPNSGSGVTTAATSSNLRTSAGSSATTNKMQTSTAKASVTTAAAEGRSSVGQAGVTTKPPSSTTVNVLTGDDKYFGPKAKWHEQVMEALYELVKYSGKGLYHLAPQRLQAISAFLNTLYYGHKEDFERYSYIPKPTLDGLVTLMKMAIGQNLPRLFDNIPAPILSAVNAWMNEKYQKKIDLGSSPCHFQEGLELALNVTQELLVQKQWQDRNDQLVMLAHIFRIFLKDDHTQYLSELLTRISAAEKMGRTWMIRDGIPIHEPDEKDICHRYTAVKLWQLKTYPVFQFAGRTVSPDQYQSVFWSQEKGTIFRGDRSELTGQVFWSKVATCSCPAGSTCGGNVAMTQNGVNTMTGNAPVTARPMAVAPLRVQVDEGIDLTNDDDKDSIVGFGFGEAEDMMFGE